jgi:Na+/glutamate symporter
MSDINFEAWQTIIIAIPVLFLGQTMNKRIRLLNRFNIPEPVSRGGVVAIFIAAYFLTTGKTIRFSLFFRDILLVVFACVGFSSSIAELKQGGRPFFILLFPCRILIFMQNSVDMGIASLMGVNAHVEVTHGAEVPVSEDSFIYTVFIIGLAVGMGIFLNQLLMHISFRLPASITCMFSGILLSNRVPLVFKKLDWPTRHASLNLISDLSLGLFLSLI